MLPFLGTLSSFLLVVSIFLLASFVSILLHELGHAIPILCMGDKPVDIFVGSFGDTHHSLRGRIGRLSIYISYNPLLWRRGICKPQDDFSVYKTMLYVATGPLMSFLLVLLCWWLLAHWQFSSLVGAGIGVVLFVSAVATISSAIPRRVTFSNNTGDVQENDAMIFLRLYKHRHLPPDLQLAAGLIAEGKYREAAGLLDQLLADEWDYAEIYRPAIFAHLKLQNNERALALSRALEADYPEIAEDHCNAAVALLRLARPAEALQKLEKAMTLLPDNSLLLSNAGYALSMMNRDQEALDYLDKAINKTPDFAYAYSNRGWAKVKLGFLEEGYADLQYSLTLDDTNSYVYRNLALYHIKKNEPSEAIKLLEKAKAMDSRIPLIDEYLAEARSLNILANRPLASGE